MFIIATNKFNFVTVIHQILKKYNVDFERGFLPAQDPLLKLPSRYQDWEVLATNLTPYINAGVVREKIDELPLIEHPEFNDPAALERAMLLLSFFAHAYVHSPPKPRNYIPATISIPWIKVAKALNRKPILSHSSVVLNNWRRLDLNRPIQLDNLSTLCQFHGGLDESWFYLVTVEIEQTGAKAIPLLLETMKYVAEEEFSKASNCLEQVNLILSALIVVLKKIYTNCDPHIFYLRVRPFLASFEEIEYRGSGLPLQSHHGGSAAQSSLLQFFDAAFGIEYKNQSTKAYLRLMRHHMPMKHAAFLAYIENTSKIRNCTSKSKKLEQVYKKSIDLLIEFRNEHLKMVALYIMKQSKKTQSTAKGTGGTNPMVFLKSVRNQNEDLQQNLK